MDLPQDPLLAARPYELVVPLGYDARQPTPLLILLHGYGANGVAQNVYFGLSKLADEKRFLYAYPDGTLNGQGYRFWNATDACCNLEGADVDDVAYLRALIGDVKARYNVDARRLFLVGHSNGGFMAYRMACDAADLIAGIVSLAGATWKRVEPCSPKATVAVLQVHGDSDDVIRYDGGRFMPMLAEYPSAHDTVAQWAGLNGCSGTLFATGAQLDLDVNLPGAETRVERYAGCSKAAVELRTIAGGSHLPRLQPTFGATVYEFLMAHPKP